ncbi:DsrE family protein [Hymenobacter sp. DG25B]|uniref:DsrE family protein n=1 Tax=Hymenobacter sp. DG25B TaxID=1385664 RepID=UPI000AC6141E|nr:DsrE family protein [Hymenobacter sp. DG25B]
MMTSLLRLSALAALLLTGCATSHAQTTAPTKAATEFAGAVADKAEYKVVYQLDSNDPKLISQTLHNMLNALEDPRLKGKLQMELVAFSGGTDVYLKTQPYEADLQALRQKGVLLAQCLNSMKKRNLSKEDLFPFVSYVPTGNGELIIRQAQGWAIVHP